MAAAPPPIAPAPVQPVPFGARLQNFWRRVTEGLALSQLWSQFETEARASYHSIPRMSLQRLPKA